MTRDYPPAYIRAGVYGYTLALGVVLSQSVVCAVAVALIVAGTRWAEWRLHPRPTSTPAPCACRSRLAEMRRQVNARRMTPEVLHVGDFAGPPP